MFVLEVQQCFFVPEVCTRINLFDLFVHDSSDGKDLTYFSVVASSPPTDCGSYQNTRHIN